MSAFTCQSNGNLYPSRQLTQAELATLVGLVHTLACKEGLSRRQVRKRLVNFGVMRSVGAISQYLSRYECPRCAATPAEPEPAPAPRPAVIAWR